MICVPIAMFLIVWGWFCRSFSSLVFLSFFSLVLLDYISPNICCKAGLVVLNSLNFCLSKKFLISPSILNEILAGYSNLGCRFFPFSTLNISCHSLLVCRVSAEISTANHMRFSLVCYCLYVVAFPLLLLIFFLSVASLLVWLVCVLACFSLDLSYMGLFAPLGLDWLFPFPYWGNFQL